MCTPLTRVSQCNAGVFKRGAAKSQRLIKGHLDGKMKTWQPERLTSSHIKELPKQRGSTHGSARKISASFTATQGERPPSFFLSDCLSMGVSQVFFFLSCHLLKLSKNFLGPPPQSGLSINTVAKCFGT